MASRIGIKLNQLVEATYAAGDITTSFVAVEVDTRLTRSPTIYSIDAFAMFDSLADRNNMIQQRVVVFRGLQLRENIDINTQTGSAERVFGVVSSESQLSRDFAKSVILPPGHTYTFALYPVDMNAALAGNVRAGLVVRGDLIPTRGVEAPRQPEPVSIEEVDLADIR